MEKQIYHWKRFWSPRSSQINLTDDGYLYDPDTKWGKGYNQDLVTLEDIADVPCLILLGEPGIGKSHELDNLKVLTEQNICDPSQILELNLRSCTNLKDDLFKDEIFTDWLKGRYHLYLFLDSLDEGLLNISTLATGLIDELKKPKYQNHINRLHLRLACRTFVFPVILEEGLQEFWKKDNFAIYELAPLRRIDVIEAAKAESFSPDDFLRETDCRDVVPLAIKPITLRFLLNKYRCHDSQFPPNQKLYELYRDGCKLLCEEVNKSRLASDQIGKFDGNQRLIVAARIAAVTIFTNRFAIWTEVDQGNIPAEDLFIQTLCFGCETANRNVFQVSKEAIKEVLDTGLFSSRGSNRMGWAHQTYSEFLAAWYLTQHEISLDIVKKLLFSSEDPDHKLIPQLHETAAWLASMRTDVFQEIVNTDPDVLLRSDVPTDADFKAILVRNLLTQYEEETLFDRYRHHYHNYKKLNHPGLVKQLRPYICDSTKQIDARHLAIDIAEICELSELQEELVDIVLDSSQSIFLRAIAARAIGSIGDATTILKLKPLAFKPLQEDEQDRLKGYIFQAVWPEFITAEELFQALTPPKKPHFFGSYQSFLKDKIVSQLQPNDLVVALNWLERQDLRCFGHPFEELGNDIVLKVWDNFHLPGIAESFTKVALIQWRRHKKIITSNSQLQEQFASSLLSDTSKRHTLIEQAVLLISEIGGNPVTLLCIGKFTDKILTEKDIYWLLKKLQDYDNEKTDKIWAELIQRTINYQDAKQIDAILVATQTNDVLREMFAPYFTAIELDSDKAKRMIAEYIEWQEMQARSQNPQSLDPLPKERVIQVLENLETGNLSAWWQLNMEMTLKPESRYYGNEFELDLTKLPGWQDAEEATRERIIEGAKKYIQQFDDIDYKWIGTNTFNRADLAGCRALQLLLHKSPDFIDQLTSEVWKRWASIIIAVPNNNPKENFYLELVKRAYLNAPEEFIKTVIKLIDSHSQQSENLSVIYRLEECWDERLQLAMLEKAKDPMLKAKCVGQLIEALLKQGLTEAKDVAKSLIDLPLPSDKNEREKVLIAARILVENSNSDSWLFAWELIEQDSSFGREVFELVAERYSFGFPLNLNEKQLADLYIWLVHQYPCNEDPDYSNEVMAHIVTAREGIGRLRDSVLSQLEEKGSLQACDEIQRIIKELPDITGLEKTLINAQTNMRRETWKFPTPEEFLQLVISQEPSNLELSDQLNTINQRTKKMEDEPKIDNRIDNRINISDLNNSFVSNISNSSQSSIESSVSSSDSKKGINWGNWIGVIAIVVAIFTIFGNGLFNEEIRQWLNGIFSPKVEQQSTPRSE